MTEMKSSLDTQKSKLTKDRQNADDNRAYVWKLVPRYALPALILALLMNTFCYNASRLFTSNWPHHCLQFSFEPLVPLFPPAIWIYVLAFVQWIVSYIVIARQTKETAYRLVSADIWAKFITMAIFILLPTTVARETCNGQDLSSMMLRAIRSVDPSDNLFPSIHCLESWLCFRATHYMSRVLPAYRWGMFVFTLLVFASVLLTGQHTIIDIPAGMLMVEAGLLLTRKWRLDALFDRAGKLVYSRKIPHYEEE